MFETLSQACLYSDVGGAPVLVITDAVHNWLHSLSLQRQRLVEGSQFEGIVWKPVHGIVLWRHLKQPSEQHMGYMAKFHKQTSLKTWS